MASSLLLLLQDAVGDAARVDRQAVVVQHAAKRAAQLRFAVHQQQAQHLRVAVLLDDVHAIVTGG